jgi:hypothetical protein
MDCPRCGKPAREGDRFCRSCGADFAELEHRSSSLGERIRRLAGGSRRERLLTAGTAVAVVVAIVSFIALGSSEDDAGEDAYLAGADQICVEAKQRIAAAAPRALERDRGTVGYAKDLLRGAVEWRSRLDALAPPPGLSDEAGDLEEALREVVVEVAALARVAREQDRARVVDAAAAVDDASRRVEAAIDELGLEQCGSLALAPPQQPQS